MHMTKKILILDNKPIRRGAQIFAHELRQELVSRGLDCRIVYLYRSGEKDLELPREAENRYLDREKGSLFELLPNGAPGLSRQVLHEITEFGPDIVLLNGARSVKYGGMVSKMLHRQGIRIPFVVRIIDSVVYWNRSSLKQWYMRHLIVPGIDGAVGVGEKALQEFRDLYGFRGPGTAIPRAFHTDRFRDNGSRSDARQHLDRPQDRKVVLFLGNITRQKRPDRFLDVFANVADRQPKAEAWIVGDGSLRNETEIRAAELGIKDRVIFWGYRDNVAPFITGSDLLFISSDTEGVPGIALESLYLERPVVSTDAGDTGMAVKDGVTGYLCAKDDTVRLADRIHDLLTDSQKNLMMGRNGRQHILEYFNLQCLVDRYLEFFDTLILKKPERQVHSITKAAP
jgi:glycosyltransferase involved in cell wall biosynthesis